GAVEDDAARFDPDRSSPDVHAAAPAGVVADEAANGRVLEDQRTRTLVDAAAGRRISLAQRAGLQHRLSCIGEIAAVFGRGVVPEAAALRQQGAGGRVEHAAAAVRVDQLGVVLDQGVPQHGVAAVVDATARTNAEAAANA